jgi:hypothetical protein
MKSKRVSREIKNKPTAGYAFVLMCLKVRNWAVEKDQWLLVLQFLDKEKL